MQVEITVDVARCLYVSLLTDTGGFRYQNTSARALRLAARFLELGIDAWELSEPLFERQPEAKTRLMARVLTSLWRSSDGTLGVVAATAEDLAAAQAQRSDLHGIVNHVRAIDGVEIAVLLDELSPTSTRAVFRSRGKRAVAPIAAALGGTGHKNAATVVLPWPLAEAKDRVAAAVAQ
jgi:bifunctional oligoribonuclease and PAP phosphatase NrnA